jgi:peptide-methionine (S)-S-oxide reductase
MEHTGNGTSTDDGTSGGAGVDTSGESSGGIGGRTESTAVVTLGGGCFWCTEAVFLDVRGVTAVEPGYAGGHVRNPTYEAVCAGDTGHAEVVQVRFDPAVISLWNILAIFFTIHDPTTLNRQGHDVGTQYRSVIFYRDDEQAATAHRFIRQLEEEKVFRDPIVTEVAPLTEYSTAEPNHHRYFEQHPSQGYCTMVVAPKLSKFRKVHAALRRR